MTFIKNYLFNAVGFISLVLLISGCSMRAVEPKVSFSATCLFYETKDGLVDEYPTACNRYLKAGLKRDPDMNIFANIHMIMPNECPSGYKISIPSIGTSSQRKHFWKPEYLVEYEYELTCIKTEYVW